MTDGEIHATASVAAQSDGHGVRGGIDFEITVTIGGRSLAGEVTLAPGDDGRLQAYGPAPDYWVSGALLSELRALSDRQFRQALDEMEGAAIEAARGAGL